jgi:hypothetical protein
MDRGTSIIRTAAKSPTAISHPTVIVLSPQLIPASSTGRKIFNGCHFIIPGLAFIIKARVFWGTGESKYTRGGFRLSILRVRIAEEKRAKTRRRDFRGRISEPSLLGWFAWKSLAISQL